MYIFTYYNKVVSPFFVRSIKSVSSVFHHTMDTVLIIITDDRVPDKTVNLLTPYFGEISIIAPKLGSLIQNNSSKSSVNVSFLETLLLYSDYDRLYVDPSLFLVNSFLLLKEDSVFFKQHTGNLSTKLAYLKSGHQFISAFSPILNTSGYSAITNQAFTYVIANNFLIKKKLSDKQIVSGRLFENSAISEIYSAPIIAIDMSEILNLGGNTKVWSTIKKIENQRKPIVLTGIKKRKKLEQILKTTDLIFFGKPNGVSSLPIKPKKNRITLDAIFNKSVDSLGKNKQSLLKFTDPTRLTIIVPVYKNANLTADCLQSLVDSTPDYFNLLVINDSPTDKEVEKLGNVFSLIFNEVFIKSEYIFLTNSDNFGFIRTVNIGLSLCKGDVILLNSDTIVSPGWTDRLLAYKSLAKVASVTPLSNSASQCSFPIQDKSQPHYRGLHPNLIDKVFSKLPIENFHESPTGVGFCMLMTKEALLEIGYLDEINFKIGYGEENDWCWRAVNEGFVNIIAPNVYVAHEHGASFADVKNVSEIRLKNKQALVQKYPNYFSIISEYYNKKLLDPIYSWLKYALDFHYSRPITKPVKLVLGEKQLPLANSTMYSEFCINILEESFELSANDFLIDKTTAFKRVKNSIKSMICLLDPILIEVSNPTYLNIPEIKEVIASYEPVSSDHSIVVELPYSGNSSSGGINRMQTLVFELPKYQSTSGGIVESLKFLHKFPKNFVVSARFQKIIEPVPEKLSTWTVGMPDSTFPKCDVCITYSDTPYLQDLVKLPQVNKVLIYMLSYGMAIDRERKNVHTPNVTVMCSTKKLEKAISAEGISVHRVGFAIDTDDMYVDNNIERKNYLAIMYHHSLDKRYELAVDIANQLYSLKKIDGVITFGGTNGYDTCKKPIGLVKHYSVASRDEIRQIFNTCKCYLMPSISEGLNLSPIESTLCGCPAVICDGAIDELFFDNTTCFIAEVDNAKQLNSYCEHVLSNFDKYSNKFRNNLYSILKNYTWENVIKNIMALI